MAFELTTRAELLSQKQNIEQQIILQIDGITEIFGARPVTRILKIGDTWNIGDPGIVIGGVEEEPNSRDWISLQNTTKNIAVQAQRERGVATSVSRVNIEIVDVGGQVTQILSPGVRVDDVLARKADVYLNFIGGAHPEDSIKIFSGVVDTVDSRPGSYVVGIAHPEQLKRQTLLQKYNSVTNGAIGPADTTISVETTLGFLESQDLLTSYIRIEDEIIQVGGVSGSSFTGCTRGSLGTVAASHGDDIDVESFYRLQGDPIEIALKMMLSKEENTFATESATRFVVVEAGENVANAVFFPVFDIEEKLGLVQGDLITVSGASEASNNFTERSIRSFGTTATGSYVVVDGASLSAETDSSATATFRSQYDVLNFGCDMDPTQVDVQQHEKIDQFFGSAFSPYDFYIKDEIEAHDFIQTEIYRPAGMYQIPRKGKASLNITAPPLAELNTKTLSEDNIKRADSIKVKRTTTNNFYNAVVYKYNEDVLDDRFLAGQITQSADSTNRIKIGNKPLTIQSKGLRRSGTTTNLIQRNSNRVIDRYKFGAEKINIQTDYKTGFNIEIGDTVILSGENLSITDSLFASKDFQPRIMECVNKSLNIITGDVKLDLLDTAYDLDGRYGTISPSSFTDASSTTTSLRLKRSFSTSELGFEYEKWERYVGEKLLVRSVDFTFQEEVALTNVERIGQGRLSIDPALSVAPPEGYIIDIINYPNSSDPKTAKLLKTIHAFFTPRVDVSSGASDTVFDVADPSVFFVDAFIRVHSFDYSIDSPVVQVTDVTGSTITVDESLGFTPASGQFVDRIGFVQDKGKAYLYV